MRQLVLLTLAAMGTSSVAHGDDCSNAADQRAVAACVGQALKQSDAELNATYGQIQQRLKNDPATAKLLVGAQRAWVAFRDAECNFSSSSSLGGTVYPMIVALCADRLTRQRIDGLKVYLRCQASDTDCPVPPG